MKIAVQMFATQPPVHVILAARVVSHAMRVNNAVKGRPGVGQVAMNAVNQMVLIAAMEFPILTLKSVIVPLDGIVPRD